MDSFRLDTCLLDVKSKEQTLITLPAVRQRCQPKWKTHSSMIDYDLDKTYFRLI